MDVSLRMALFSIVVVYNAFSWKIVKKNFLHALKYRYGSHRLTMKTWWRMVKTVLKETLQTPFLWNLVLNDTVVSERNCYVYWPIGNKNVFCSDVLCQRPFCRRYVKHHSNWPSSFKREVWNVKKKFTEDGRMNDAKW